MSKSLSIYLDFLRFLAAMAVFVGHAKGYVMPEIPRIIGSHADEGVAVFFVLSGFVICYVVDVKERDWRKYAFSRFVRMFSVVPIALAITYAVDNIGLHHYREGYENISWFDQNYLSPLLRSISFTNEVWALSSTFGTNHAYWSLGFEVQYYIAFAIISFLPLRWSFLFFLLWVSLVGPLIVLYASLWGMGVVLYFAIKADVSHDRKITWAILCFSCVAYFALKLGFRDYKIGIPNWGTPPELLGSFLYNISLGVIVSANIYAAKGLNIFSSSHRFDFGRAIRWAAGGSFTLYLLHEPLLAFLQQYRFDNPENQFWMPIALIGVFFICYLVAEIGERRKREYERFLQLFFVRMRIFIFRHEFTRFRPGRIKRD